MYDEAGREFELTHDEELYYRALKRLERYAKRQGRIELFGNGQLNIRINGGWAENNFDQVLGIRCDGGDGGDYSPGYRRC